MTGPEPRQTRSAGAAHARPKHAPAASSCTSPRRPAGPWAPTPTGSWTGWPPPAGWWQVLPARTARPPPLPVQGPLGLRRLAGAAGRPPGSGEHGGGDGLLREHNAWWVRDWERWCRPRGGRPTRSASSVLKCGKRCGPTHWSAGCASVRRPRDLRGPSRRRSSSAPRGGCFCEGWVAGAPPIPSRRAANSGATRSTTGPALQRAAATGGGPSGVGSATLDLCLRSRSADRSLPGASSRTGRFPLGPEPNAGRATGTAAPDGRSSMPSTFERLELGPRLPFVAEDLGVITPSRGAAAGTHLRAARDARAPVRLGPPRPPPAPTARTTISSTQVV